MTEKVGSKIMKHGHTEEKQLQGIELEAVLEKQRLGKRSMPKNLPSVPVCRIQRRVVGFVCPASLLFMASSSGRISSNGARIKMELAVSLKNFRKTTVSKLPPTFLHGLHKYCSTLVNPVQSKTIFRGSIYLHFTCTSS